MSKDDDSSLAGEPAAPETEALAEESGTISTAPKTLELESARTALQTPQAAAPKEPVDAVGKTELLEPARARDLPGGQTHLLPAPGPGAPPGGPGTTQRSRFGAAQSELAQTSNVAESRLRPFGPYSHVEVLASQGSMGIVARGQNEAFGRWELLKFLRPELAAEAEVVRQFKREGRVMAQLSHPNVVQVFATYELDGRTCLAMEFLEGESLEEHVTASGGRLESDRATALMLEAARGLSAAHEVGLLHRDIKPENLFVTNAGKGRVAGLQLIDFGLATADRTRGDTLKDRHLHSETSGGTPLFMAPELWAGHAATPRSDLYALGLTFYWTLAGRYPCSAVTLEGVRASAFADEPHLSLRELEPGLPPGLIELVDRLIAKGPEARPESADEVVVALLGVDRASRPRKVPGAGPYRGLEPFTAAERDVFFGRDREISEVTERLRTQPAVLMAGPSGSGKSSLARAGILPAVVDGALGGGVTYSHVILEPRRRPMRSLAAALAPLTPGSQDDLATFLARTPERLGEALREGLAGGRGAIILIDQLEELATLAEDPSEVVNFALAIESLVEVVTPQLRVVATVRADLMDRLFVHEPLRGLLTSGFYPVRPLLGENLERALIEPAQVAGYQLENEEIARQIMADVARTQAGLPLMSFAMSAWWEARDRERKVLPSAAWKELGGLAGALTRHADTVVESLGPEQRRAAAQMLARLVSADGTRLRVSDTELTDPAAVGPAARPALDKLLGAKLLMEHAGEVELVHEALIESWPWLVELVRFSGDDRVFRERVSAAARQWEAESRPDGVLWDGAQAARLLSWFEGTEAPLSQLELAFVDAVRRRARLRRGLRRGFLGGALVVATLLVFGVLARDQRLAAELAQSRAVASSAQSESVSERSRLHRELGQQLAETNPARALREAQLSRELRADPALDPIGWQAILHGVPRLLPSHSGGARLVRFAADHRWLATAGSDRRLNLLAVAGAEHHSTQLPAEPTALLLQGQGRAAVGLADGSVWVVEPDGVKHRYRECTGPVSELRPGAQAGQLQVRCLEAGSVRAVVFDGTQEPMRTDGVGLSAQALPWQVFQETPNSPLTVTKAGEEVSGLKLEGVGLGELSALGVVMPQALLIVGQSDGKLRVRRLEPAGAGEASEKGAPAHPSELEAGEAETHSTPIIRLSVAPGGEGRWVAMDRAHRVSLWQGHKRSAVFEVQRPLMAWVQARRLIAVVQQKGRVSLLGYDGALRASLAVEGTVSSLAADPDGGWLIVATREGSVLAFDLEQASPRGVASEGSCGLSGDGEGLLCLVGAKLVGQRFGAPPKTLAELPESARQAPIEPGSPATRLVIAGDSTGAGLWVSGPRLARRFDRRLSLLAPSFNQALSEKTGPPLLVSDQRGRHLALTGGGFGALLVTDGASRPLAVSGTVTALGFSEHAELLGVGGLGRLDLFDTATRERKFRIEVPGDVKVTAVAPGQGNNYWGVDDGSVYQQKQGGKVERLGGPVDPAGSSKVACVIRTREGRALIVASESGALQLIDLETRRWLALHRLPGKLLGCVRSQASDRVAFHTESGFWTRHFDLRSIWMLPAIDDSSPLKRGLGTWKGLAVPHSER